MIQSWSSAFRCDTASVCSCFCWRNMLNKKAKSNQGENATLPPREWCHLYFTYNGEQSNENTWAAPRCRSPPLLEQIWPANDSKTTWNCLDWVEKKEGEKAGGKMKISWVCMWVSSESNQRRGGKKRKNTSNDPFKDAASLCLPGLTQLVAVNLRRSSNVRSCRTIKPAETPEVNRTIQLNFPISQMRAYHPDDLLWFLRSAASKATCHTAGWAQMTHVYSPAAEASGWLKVSRLKVSRRRCRPTQRPLCPLSRKGFTLLGPITS